MFQEQRLKVGIHTSGTRRCSGGRAVGSDSKHPGQPVSRIAASSKTLFAHLFVSRSSGQYNTIYKRSQSRNSSHAGQQMVERLWKRAVDKCINEAKAGCG